MKRVKFEDLQVGERYCVECGIWQMSNMMYLGLIPFIQGNGKVTNKPMFTCGNLETYLNNVNIHASKSNIKVYQ